MEDFEKVRKKFNRHTRYVYSKDSKRRLEYYGLVPKEPSVQTVTMTIGYQLAGENDNERNLKNFNRVGLSRRLIPAYSRFWVFSDCTFLDNSTIQTATLIKQI